MYQLWVILQIIIGWTIIIGIFEYMIEDGLTTELQRLFKDRRRRD